MSRPRVLTDEQRAANKIAHRAANKAKTKNITIDADLLDALNAKAEELTSEFGFRPTLSQTVRTLILRSVPKPTKPNLR